jgi:MFS family permease
MGSAFVSPATLSILSSSFAEGEERQRAVAAWGAMGALGGTLGALLGGLLTQTLGWPAIFAVNVPIGAVIVVGALRVVPPHRPAEAPRNLDIAGAALITLALGAFTYAVVRTDGRGWGSAGVLAPLAASIALLATFVFVERRVATAPLVPLHVFRIERVTAGNVLVAVMLPARMSGLGSALMNTSRLLGGALGLALLAAVAAAHTRAAVGVSAGQALTDGFSRSLTISAAVCAMGAILALVLLRTPRAPRLQSVMRPQ